MEWAPGDHATVKRFEGYWKKDKDGNRLPYLDQVVYREITDPSTALANLRTGQGDLLRGVQVADLQLIKNDPNLAYTIRKTGGGSVNGVAMNTQKPPFNNKALRQAVALGVDREGVAVVQGEGAMVFTSLLHPDGYAYDPKVAQFPARDVAKAKAKMAEAGYASGLKVTYLTASIGNNVRQAEVLKANLAEIGMDMAIEVVAQAAWDTRLNSGPPTGGDYQIGWGTTGAGVRDPGHVFSQFYHSKGSRNFMGPYSNPKVDELIEKAGSTYDQKESAPLYQQAAAIMVDDAPHVPTAGAPGIGARNKRVRNWFYWYDNRSSPTEVWLAP